MKSSHLDNLIICPKCSTLHKKATLTSSKDVAYCSYCDHKLYRSRPYLIDKGLSLGLSALLLFIIANAFPIVTIDISGMINQITLSSIFIELFHNQFYFIALLSFALIFFFPLLLHIFYITLLLLFRYKKGKVLAKEILKIVTFLLSWNMLEIFLISILVALVKLIGHASIDFGLSFWALVFYVCIDIYLYKDISIFALWELHDRTYHDK